VSKKNLFYYLASSLASSLIRVIVVSNSIKTINNSIKIAKISIKSSKFTR
jgi:hypothetical protein